MDENKKHFVCKSCKGTSEEGANCSTEGCSLNGQAMKECDCKDSKHETEEKSENPQE